MTFLRLLWLAFRLAILNELQYRTNFFVQLLQTALSLATGLAGLEVVFSHTATLQGWRPADLLALLGVFFIVGGLVNMVLQPSLQRFMEDVRQGTLDFTLTKPEDAQWLASVREVQVWKLVDVTVGLVILVVALSQLGRGVSVFTALEFGFTLLTGMVIVYSFLLILATCSFWFIRVTNLLAIFFSMYEAGRWPVSIYPVWLRIPLTFLVPVAFALTVPVEALTGRLAHTTLLSSVMCAMVLFAVARTFWKIGLRHYTGASA